MWMMWRGKKTVHLRNLGLSSNQGRRMLLLFGNFSHSTHFSYDMIRDTQLVQDDNQVYTLPVAICVISFGARINILSIIKDVKILVLIKWSYGSSFWLLGS